ncbi:MAG: SET domain-containing protein [Candidatus Shapirobacteria bacterium]|nr:SET domain-containing protein [Candidatus Shapirobacteria bacterium]
MKHKQTTQIAIEIRRTPHNGRGVFALKDFTPGEIIENCPIINVTPVERKYCEKTILNYYIYPWRSTRSGSIVLGYGSIYNHSFDPNADWKQNFKTYSMVYKAIKPIKKGEEITVNYNGEPDDTTPIDWLVWEEADYSR